ncbi:TetR/AcrR family transcriptional regulator [Deinococcus sonorensis]|uniref:TetR/AcrR family transcriptional regulator n=2 Tax=Deinococcus sonorensis TaxID=309891 RepID=A0AAU7UFZ3_9DEIO
MTAPASRRRLPSADRRHQILEAAAALFVQRGFEAVSMADIAGALGVSRPTIYSYFASPEAVLDALLEERMQQLWARLAPLLQGSSDHGQRPAPQLFATVFRFLLEERAELALLRCGGGPSFQTRRTAFLATLAQRIEPQRPASMSRLPHLLLIVTTLLEGMAFTDLTGTPLTGDALASSLDTFIRGGIEALQREQDGHTPPG